MRPRTSSRTKLQALVKDQGNDPLTVFSYARRVLRRDHAARLSPRSQGGATDGATIKDNLQSVSEGGTKCKSFTDCAKLIADGEDIDYDGISGPITFDKNGDPTEAYVSIYKYATGNKTSFEEQVFGKLD